MIDLVVIYLDHLWTVTGRRFDLNFVDISSTSSSDQATPPISHLTTTTLSSEQAAGLTLLEARTLYPEHFL